MISLEFDTVNATFILVELVPPGVHAIYVIISNIDTVAE